MYVCALGHAYGPQPERGVFRTTDAGATWTMCYSSTRTRAVPTLPWTRRTRLVDLQMDMVDLRLTGQGQDGVRFGTTLLQKLGYLTGATSGADFPPTDQELEVKAPLHGELREHLEALDALVRDEVAALNEMLPAPGILIIAGG